MEDFIKSMDEVRPEFGVDDHKMDIYSKASLFSYGQRYEKVVSDANKIIEEVKKN